MNKYLSVVRAGLESTPSRFPLDKLNHQAKITQAWSVWEEYLYLDIVEEASVRSVHYTSNKTGQMSCLFLCWRLFITC